MFIFNTTTSGIGSWFRAKYQSRIDGRDPLPVTTIEAAMDPEIRKRNSAGGLKWGYVSILLNTAFGGGFAWIGSRVESGFWKFVSYSITASNVVGLGLAAIFTHIGKHPIAEQIEESKKKNSTIYSTEDTNPSSKITTTMSDYAYDDNLNDTNSFGSYLESQLFKKLDDGPTFLNLCGAKGTGKSFLTKCLAGEIKKRSNGRIKEVKVVEINAESLGTSGSDEFNSVFKDIPIPIPGLKNLAKKTRIELLEARISEHIADVQNSIGSDGKPTKHIIISLDEIRAWLGPEEWKDHLSTYNPAEPSQRSAICNSFLKLIEKLIDQKVKGITIMLKSNASKGQMDAALADRTNPKYMDNPSQSLREIYFRKVFQKIHEKAPGIKLEDDDYQKLAAIGTKSILNDCKRFTTPYEKIGSANDHFLENYNHITFRQIVWNVVDDVLKDVTSSTTKPAFMQKLTAGLQREFKGALSEATWKSELAKKFNFWFGYF